MSDAETPGDLDERIADLRARATSLTDKGLYRSEAAVCRELRRLAKAEGQLLPYMDACFHLMNHAGSRLEPETGAEVAIELIALLENEDHARLIQPDLPDEPYASAQAWMTACAYDNLALATGRTRGFNSDGLHACINEGIQVCRRTGKLQCITCFREYATHVYMAADDLDLARHFARMGELHQEPGPHDRRWVGVRDQALIDLYLGDLAGALDAAVRSWRMSDAYHSPAAARRESRGLVKTILLMMGRIGDLDDIAPGEDGEPLPAGENPEDEYMEARNEALRLCVEGDSAAAIPILEKYERLFDQRKYLHEWFETKLRILAALRLAGRDDALAIGAKTLRDRAETARDWFTLRRLARLLDPEVTPTPLALLGDVSVGPFAAMSEDGPPIDSPAGDDTEDEAHDEGPELSPMQARISGLFGRLRDTEDFATESAAIQAEILAIDLATVTQPIEAAPLLYLARMLASEESNLAALWSWVRKVAEPFPREANIVNQVAALGGKLVTELGVEADGDLGFDALTSLFRRSLDLDPEDGGNFARAGTFYLAIEYASEAERCLARSFRLDRSSGYVATKLAGLYSSSGRGRDALAILDMCLREGSDDADVSFEAATLATNLEQWEACLSYCEHFEANRPGEPWISYYKASALLELGRGAEALEAAEEESRRNPEAPFASRVLACCALANMGELDAYRTRLEAILDGRLSEIDYLTHRGLLRLHLLLWKSAHVLDRDEPLKRRFDDHLLAADMTPNEFFDEVRKTNEITGDLNFYHVIFDQPLDEAWARSSVCLANETEWTSYRIPWGVLARDEDEAREMAEPWQARCYPVAAEILAIELQDDGFRDAPGIVWQGLREASEEE